MNRKKNSLKIMFCRLCLNKSEAWHNVTNSQLKCGELTLIESLYWIFGVKVDVNDPFPKYICIRCKHVIQYVGTCRTLYQRNQLILKEKFDHQPKEEHKSSMVFQPIVSLIKLENCKTLNQYEKVTDVLDTAKGKLIEATSKNQEDNISKRRKIGFTDENLKIATFKYSTKTKCCVFCFCDNDCKYLQPKTEPRRSNRKKIAERKNQQINKCYNSKMVMRRLNRVLEPARVIRQRKKKILFDSRSFPNLNYVKWLDKENSTLEIVKNSKVPTTVNEPERDSEIKPQYYTRDKTVSVNDEFLLKSGKSVVKILNERYEWLHLKDFYIPIDQTGQKIEKNNEKIGENQEKEKHDILKPPNSQHGWLNLKNLFISLKRCTEIPQQDNLEAEPLEIQRKNRKRSNSEERQEFKTETLLDNWKNTCTETVEKEKEPLAAPKAETFEASQLDKVISATPEDDCQKETIIAENYYRKTKNIMELNNWKDLISAALCKLQQIKSNGMIKSKSSLKLVGTESQINILRKSAKKIAQFQNNGQKSMQEREENNSLEKLQESEVNKLLKIQETSDESVTSATSVDIKILKVNSGVKNKKVKCKKKKRDKPYSKSEKDVKSNKLNTQQHSVQPSTLDKNLKINTVLLPKETTIHSNDLGSLILCDKDSGVAPAPRLHKNRKLCLKGITKYQKFWRKAKCNLGIEESDRLAKDVEHLIGLLSFLRLTEVKERENKTLNTS